MEQIDLTGVYPGGEGAILQVQRFEDGSWDDFPVAVSVSGETSRPTSRPARPARPGSGCADTDTGEHLQRGQGHTIG